MVVSFDVHYGRDSRMERCLFRGNESRSGPGALLADGVNLTLLRTFVDIFIRETEAKIDGSAFWISARR